ncbi:Transmembrane protein 106B [Acropora cervicornis]|uniref:Transmembrane protein 106B n=1 Tax=Acropora cervicornis TaxID=6130 RepID=A0AAD9QZX0_ACRCE|nr:Transmembrane protein 106B [Acropora cervicornis]
MSRWFGRKGRHEMSSYEKNILSDPTSDGNVHGDNFSADPTASPPPYRYEEFDRRLGTDRENDSETSDFTQTCPTCGGTGKLTREQENDLVALIPVRDSRLKPRRTMLYLLLAIFLGVVISVVAGVFLFPRSISIKLEKAVPLNVSMSLSNTTKPFIVINHSFSVKTVYGFANQEAKKIRRVCCGWSFNLAFLITVSAKTHSLTVSSEASDNSIKYVNCELEGASSCL